jgi:hypothetical protein
MSRYLSGGKSVVGGTTNTSARRIEFWMKRWYRVVVVTVTYDSERDGWVAGVLGDGAKDGSVSVKLTASGKSVGKALGALLDAVLEKINTEHDDGRKRTRRY